jgi:hypothetical protein
VAKLSKLALKFPGGSRLLDVAGVSRSNTLREIANPGAKLAANLSEGKPLTFSSATDPAGFAHKDTVTPPPVVPMPDEEQIKANRRRRSTAAQLQRAGRQSTILSDSDRLGP